MYAANSHPSEFTPNGVNWNYLFTDVYSKKNGDEKRSYMYYDSIYQLALTVYPEIDKNITLISTNTLQSNQANASYQWYNCLTNEMLIGETNRELVVLASGSYEVVIQLNTCVELSN